MHTTTALGGFFGLQKQKVRHIGIFYDLFKAVYFLNRSAKDNILDNVATDIDILLPICRA